MLTADEARELAEVDDRLIEELREIEEQIRAAASIGKRSCVYSTWGKSEYLQEEVTEELKAAGYILDALYYDSKTIINW
jgi:hypothetical protein